ncbi:MAG: PGF-pre-PGF domain-containing protein [Candidatus Hadarchaeum sp.]|uniref:PGF-pre-PGF domain-containing protein n=1 Tax=Candidatus Hadarchaeum sp. TaxID=2883567 RepID=UPI003D0F084E
MGKSKPESAGARTKLIKIKRAPDVGSRSSGKLKVNSGDKFSSGKKQLQRKVNCGKENSGKLKSPRGFGWTRSRGSLLKLITLFFLLEILGGLLAAAAPFQVTISGVSVTFERRLSGEQGGQRKAPALSPVTMEITANVSAPVENAVLIDYFPKEWTIVDAGGGTVSEHDERYSKIEWKVGRVDNSVTRSYIFESPKPASLQPKKYHLRTELIYSGGSASGEDWVEILIEQAVHLDENRNFLSDISAAVKTRDGVWSEPISEGEWVRVTFQKELNPWNDITVYVRNTQGLNTWIEVYYPDSSEKITQFPVITSEGYYKVYLANMNGRSDTFDLKILNSDPETAYLEFDQIKDPLESDENFFPVTTETVYEGGTSNFAAAQTYSDGNYENIFENNIGSFRYYYPSGYNLLGNTKFVGGTVGNLQSNDNSTYMTFKSYPSAFSGDVQVAESEAQSTTTSTTYQDKVTLTWTPALEDNYLIIATAEIKRISTIAARTTKAQLTIDGTSVAETFVADDTDADIYRSFVAFKVANLTAASHTIGIQYATTNASNTAFIKNARIIAIRIGNNFKLSEPSDGTTTSTTYTDIATLTFTPDITENWLILAHADVTNSAAANYNGVLFLVDGENRGEFWSRQANAGHYLSAGFHDVVSLSGGSSHTIKIQMKTSAGTLTYKNVHLYAIPTAAVFQEVFAENSDSLSSTTTTAPGTTKTTLSFTPSSTGDYLFLATGQINTSSTTVYVGARLTINGTDYGNSIVDVAATAQWPTFTISKRLTNLSGGQTATISFYTQTAGTAVYIRNARLIALRLPSASAFTENVEFTGTSNTEQWDSLTWTVDSQWTADSVNVVLQLYNYGLGRYAESGEDGYLSYTSGAANTDQTQTQTITTNPTQFRDASGNWKIRVSGVKVTSTRFDLKLDWIEFKPRSPAYRENVQHNITGIPLDNYYGYRLEIGYYLAGDTEPVSVYLYNFSTGQWENIGNLTSATYTVFTYNVEGTNLIDNVNGEVRVRYVQPDNDNLRTSLMIDYAGVIAKAYKWNLIESWTATVRAPTQWYLIESWTATVQATAQWKLIESWTAAIRTTAEWRLIQSWTATVRATMVWNLVDAWTATVRATSSWKLLETWTGVVRAPVAWKLVEAWNISVRAPGVPSSKVDALTPFWITTKPFTITATASDPSPSGYVATVQLWYRYSKDKLSWGSWENFGDNTGPNSWSFTAPSGDGYYQFYSIAVDEKGNVELAPATADASCGVDTVPPSIVAVVINNNATTTNSTSVLITILAVDQASGVAQMQFSNDGVIWTAWEPFSPAKQYLLPTGSGTRTVYVRVRDNAGLISAAASDSIELVSVEIKGATAKIASIPGGMFAKFDFTEFKICVTDVKIIFTTNLENVIVTVEQASYQELQKEGKVPSQPPSGIVYPVFMEIKTNAPDLFLASVIIRFRLEKAWLEINGVDEKTIYLYRFSGGWQRLPTEYLYEDSTCVYYEAISPGLSVFAAAGERKPVMPIKPVTPVGGITPTLPSVPYEFFTMLAMAGGLAAFSIIYSLLTPSRYYLLLKRIRRAVLAPRHRVIGKPEEAPVQEKLGPKELAGLERLKEISEKKRKLQEKKED